MLTITVTIITAYLLGSISSAILVCALFRLPDPRGVGSNNPGATNVLRVGGKVPAALTLVGDMLKGVIAVSIAKLLALAPLPLSLVMIAVFLGHIYPVFFKFKGGKGVATALGAFLALSWQFAGIVIALWLAVVAIIRISSLGALSMITAAPICAWFMLDPTYAYAITFMSLVMLIKHKSNIVRLWQGAEK